MDPILNNIFYLKCCWNCEKREVDVKDGRVVQAKCSINGKTLSDRNDIKTNCFPSWCPKKRKAVINGGVS